ncbi:hypothetical protein CGC20_35945 [Leishmania donovani]|uniref:C2 NT-type domain-containing protein n=1 Tax=Leishmania donovani TaxID=5661 RepID=A0A504XZS3_LEIDO|nr:hypothetical protein CGC20_35945 [Leishmania donovani]
MPRETHVLRFKVLTVECAALPNGQQYTVMYHRGNTNRSTPCYTAQGGVINFASMPEGAAVVHFKAGHGGGRFAPKYIRFMIEEYTRGMPRRLVGETEADCTQVLKDYGASGSGILTVVFRLYGTTAKMRIAVLVYPEHAPPLSFDGLIDPSEVAAPLPPQALKVMNRGEAMMILMGLETLLERRRTMKAEGQSLPQSREEKKLAELEKRRKALVGSEGLATEVIKTRCEEVVAVQYTALARKHRNNFIGQTAAYLREMAMRAGEDFIDDDGNSSGNTVMEQLNRVNRSIEEVEMQVKKLEEEQTALGRIQHKVDVMAELSANLDKVAALQQKMQVLKESRTALTEAMKKQAARKNTPLAREVAAINARIAALNAEQQQMAPRIQHMVTVAASHVVKWARSKNPPELDIKSRIDTSRETGGNGRNAVDDLFSDDDKPKRSKEQPVMDDVQRKQVVEALKGLKTPTAPVPTRSPTSPTSASSSSGHRTPHMFSAKPAPAAASNVPAGLPSMNDFMRSSASSRQQDAQPTFDFGSILQASSVSPQMGGGFVLEPQQSEAAASSFAAAAPSAVRDAYNKRDDPYYDEMDDFTVPPDAADNKNYGAVEITGGIFGFQDDTNSPAYVASRPTFDFGPSGGGDDGPSGVGVTAPPAETFSFGGGTADEPSTNNRRNSSDDPYTGITNLPTYNFSS